MAAANRDLLQRMKDIGPQVREAMRAAVERVRAFGERDADSATAGRRRGRRMEGIDPPAPKDGLQHGPRLAFLFGMQPRHRAHRHGQRLPSGDGPGMCPRLRVIGDARE